MLPKPKVLIIEDNADLRAILEHLLSTDYLVATAGRGEDGVSLALSFRPDLVILDLQLPDMDGVDAGRAIKRSTAARVLVLSATATGEVAELLRESGCCDAFLPKPVPLEEIRAKLTDLLGSAAGAQG